MRTALKRFAARMTPVALLALAAATRAPQEQQNQYVGARTCRNCHQSAVIGAQFASWEQSRHAHAYETLATPEAAAFARERGIENAQQADACLRCHVTGHGEPVERFGRQFRRESGVQCESCHGPGGNHVRARMRDAAAPPQPRGALHEEIALATEETCRGCHNPDSPGFREFNFVERVHQIRHLIPTRPPIVDPETPPDNPPDNPPETPDDSCNPPEQP